MEEMTIELSQDVQAPERQTLKVTGKVTIEQAAQFKEALISALAEAQDITLEISGVTDLDLSALQLFCSGHRTAVLQGKRLTLLHQGNEVFERVKNDAGFQRHIGCDKDDTNSCLWVEERTDG
jgi:anti-anti-sigma regulatory factor